MNGITPYQLVTKTCNLTRQFLGKGTKRSLHNRLHQTSYDYDIGAFQSTFRTLKRLYCHESSGILDSKVSENLTLSKSPITTPATSSKTKNAPVTEKPIDIVIMPPNTEKIKSDEAWRSINPAATKEVKMFYFDTLTLANKFNDAGLTREQAVCMVEAFVEVLNTSIEHQTKNMVTKPEQEIMVQQLLAQIATVKKDMVILEKSEFTMLRNENEKQTAEIKQIKTYISDEISKLQGHVKLDVNLERSRATEAHANNEKQLQMIRNKIDTDVANLKTIYEQYRNDVIRTCLGTVVSCAAIMIAVMRLMS